MSLNIPKLFHAWKLSVLKAYDDAALARLTANMTQLADENVDMVMVFTIVSAGQERLTQLIEDVEADKVAAKERIITETDEAEQGNKQTGVATFVSLLSSSYTAWMQFIMEPRAVDNPQLSAVDFTTSSRSTETWLTTKAKVICHDFMWSIKRIREALKRSETIVSTAFKLEVDRGSVSFKLRPRRNGMSQSPRQLELVAEFTESSSMASSNVHYRGNSTSPNKPISFLFHEASILNDRNMKTRSFKDRGEFWKLAQKSTYTCNPFVGLDELLDESNGLIVDNTLHIMVTICTRADEELRVADQSTPPPLADVSHHVQSPNSEIFAKALGEGSFGDVVLHTEDREFPAHKFVLAAHSPVFRAMFESGLRESTESKVDIGDFCGEVIEQMLAYMYTGKAPKARNVAPELLKAANKYDIPGLQAVCERKIVEDLLDDENAADLLGLADSFGSQYLKKSVLYWISRNIYDVTRTAGWKTLSEAQPRLVSEVLFGVAKLVRQLSPDPDGDDYDDDDDNDDGENDEKVT